MTDRSIKLNHAFDALASDKRRGMLDTLAYRPATVTQLAQEYHLSLPAMHKHIRALEAGELIRRKKVGRINFVALNRQGLWRAQRWLVQFRTDWGNDQESLENYISQFNNAPRSGKDKK